mgnify:CR=1 FL=1|tara:strand:+ start:4873 stop:5484 length:612 start_codon:yes stop_codon:yes gene_type:complete
MQVMTKQTTVYTFDELSETAKQKAMEDYVSHFDFEMDEECILEYVVECNPHIQDMDISYSGFWSQGDGASFTGQLESDWVIQFLKEHFNNSQDITLSLIRWISISFERNSSRYSHENTCSTELSDDVEWATHIEESETLKDSFNERVSEFVEVIEEYRRDLCTDIYDRLYQAYEHATDEETISEHFAENWTLYHFEEDGSIYR